MFIFSAKNNVRLPDEVWLAYLENAMFGLQDKRTELREAYMNLANEDPNTEEHKQKWMKLENQIKNNLLLSSDISGSIEFLNKRIEKMAPLDKAISDTEIETDDTESEG